MRELVVFDGTALLFRAYYGAREPIAAPDGTEVAATWGALQLLTRHLRRLRSATVAIVFDAGRTTFRNALDPAYKANRGAPPPDLVPQFDLLREGVAALGLCGLTAPGWEADDLMATLAARAGAEGLGTRLLSVDKDLCQLVRDDAPAVVVEDPHTGRVWDGAGVQERLGVPPAGVADLLALVGDSSDNVPGVRGIGPRSAEVLLRHFGGLDALFARVGEVEALPLRGARAVAERLRGGEAEARRSLELVRLVRDVPLPFERVGEGTRWTGPAPGADAWFERIGLRAPLMAARSLAADLVPSSDQLSWLG